MARISRNYHKPDCAKKFKAAIYARLSVENNGYCDKSGNNSIDNQIMIARQFIGNKSEFEIVDCYIDKGQSGKNFNRPAFQEMIQDIRLGKFNCVIVKDLSRFGRNYIDVGNYLESIFPFLDVGFIAINDNLDTQNQPINLTSQVKAIIDEEQRKYISIATKSGLKARAIRGKMALANAPYGYNRTSDGTFMVDEITSEVVTKIFRMAADGISNVKIAKRLNDENIPTRCGGNTKWAQSTIGQILKNRFYLGEQIYKIDGETFTEKNLHTAILGDELFDKAQRKGDMRSKAVGYLPTQALVGKVICAECGRSMPRSTHMCRGQEVATYQCRTGTVVSNATCYQGTISESEISERIFIKLEKHIQPLVMKRTELKEELIDQSSKLQRRLVEIEKSISDLKRERLIDNYELLRSGKLSKEEFETRYDSTRDWIAKLKNEAIVLQKGYQMLYEEHGRICDKVKEYRAYLVKKTLSKELLDAVVDRVCVDWNGHTKIKLKD